MFLFAKNTHVKVTVWRTFQLVRSLPSHHKVLSWILSFAEISIFVPTSVLPKVTQLSILLRSLNEYQHVGS